MNYFVVFGVLIFNFYNILTPVLTTDIDEPDECLHLVEHLSHTISNFTKCSVNNSRPVNLCTACIDQYIGVLDSFNNLTKVYVNKTSCLDRYVNFDRLGVVEAVKNNAVSLWNKANCDDCYVIENKTLTNKTSKFKKQFEIYKNDFTKCVDRNKKNNDTILCHKCLDSYIVLNDYYFNVGGIKYGINGICMDIVDWMNATQLNWSDRCCKYRKHPETAFIFSMSFICFLPVLFYLSARFFGDPRKRSILSQNRFAESINAQSQSSINR